MSKLVQFDEIIRESKNIFITSHIRPDPDAIGVALGMYAYLHKKYPNHHAEIYMTGDKNEEWDFLKFADKINWVDTIKPFIGNFDTLILLDGNSMGRFVEEDPEVVNLTNFKTICIDHHPNTPDHFDVDLSDTSAASATQLVYKLFFRDQPELLSKEVAEILMFGILGDTGTFRYIKHTNSDTLIYAKELLDIGKLEIQSLDLHLTQFGVEDFEVLKELLTNTQNIELAGIPPLTYSYLPLSALNRYSLNAIKGATTIYKLNTLRQIKHHNWGFVVTPDAVDQLGISFRSTPGYPNVRLLANKFDGGGHDMAAGGSYVVQEGEKFDSEDLVEKILHTIKTEKLEL